MRKITAVFVIFSLLGGNFSSAYAQMPRKIIQGSATVKKSLQGLKYLPSISIKTTPSALTQYTRVERAARQAILGNTPRFEDLRQRALQGRTAFLPQAILAHPVPAERTELLRHHFAAAAAGATREEVTQAAAFWRTDLEQILAAPSPKAFENASADAAALGIFGTPADLPILKKFYQTVKNTPLGPRAAAVWTRALLVHGRYDELTAFFIRHNGVYPALQNGLAAYARTYRLPLEIPTASGKTDAKDSRAELAETGLAGFLASDPSEIATAIWVAMARRPASTLKKPARPSKLTIPENALYTPEQLTLSAQEISAAPDAIPGPNENSVFRTENTALPVRASREEPISAAKIPPVYANAAFNTGKNLPARRNYSPQTLAKFKQLLRVKKAAAPAGKTHAAIQRAGIYMASYVMGLEVATPVLANFGSSFGLSLEENILVAVATYLPYSLGAFFSNWTKQLLGRKNSLNLGLAFLGGGLLAGVALCGLNGAFVPEADTLRHFYKVLGCITLASLGGVLVHNSVGPLMTELNANANELVRQKRSAYTEFSRALGMASSFAFPFIATKMLNMDWSLTFALPLPLVGAAALGVNLAKIPNTKPISAPKTDLPHTKGLLDSIKNNEYIRLFKEEKGVGAFLGGLFIMNAVEMAINSGFLFLLPSMTSDQSSQYLFGLAQFAAPFLLGRYLAGKFLQWFPKHNMSAATLMAAGGGLVSLGALNNVYALTAALFLAETGISTGFTLGFARTAKNPATQDRIVSLIVASAISCAFGPLLLTNLAQTMIDSGIMSAASATAAAMIGIPSGLAILSALLFKRVENWGEINTSVLKKIYSFIKKSVFFPKQRRKRS